MLRFVEPQGLQEYVGGYWKSVMSPETLCYPIIRVPLGNEWGDWVDFDIKADTNNFYLDNKVMWLSSLFWSEPEFITNPQAAIHARVFWVPTTNGVAPFKAARTILATTNAPFSVITGAATDLNQGPAEVLVQLTPATLGTADMSAWFNQANTNLAFRYTRSTVAGGETNVWGRRIWHEARPVEWRSQPISTP